WSVVFWVNLPVGAISIAMFALFLDERVERREHRIDYLGGVLLIIGIGALMLALVQAVSLAVGQILALIAVGVAALTWLFLHERRAAEPMLPLALWRRRVLALGNVAGFGAAATYMAVSALLPTYVEGARRRDRLADVHAHDGERGRRGIVRRDPQFRGARSAARF